MAAGSELRSNLDVPADWLEELFGFLRIPSISSDRAFGDAVAQAAHWVADFVSEAGGSCEIRATGQQPLVVGRIPATVNAGSAPTIMIYGHFDVQPPGDVALWTSPPFEPEIRGGWLYCRGAADDKGNLYLLLKAVALLTKANRLPVNVLVVCDGEEEVLGTSVVDLLETNEVDADACLIFDGPMPAQDRPAFRLGTRGLITWRLGVRTGESDAHSGHFGGAAMNALNVLVAALSRVLARSGELRAGVEPPSPEELESWQELPAGRDIMNGKGLLAADGEAADEFYVRTLAEPAVDINGLQGGEPAVEKTVLPVEAHAFVSIRLAPGQDPASIARQFENMFRDALPISARCQLDRRNMTPPGVISPRAEAITLARDAFERVLGVRPLFSRSGGTIPIVPALARRRIPTILTGFDVPEGNVHAPNERLKLAYVHQGVQAAQESLLALAKLRPGVKARPQRRRDEEEQ